MNDLLNGGPFTAFDYIVAALILTSGLMALARGFLREVASTLAFSLAIGAGLFALYIGAPFVREKLPIQVGPILIEVILVAASFLLVYIISAWLGRKLSRLIHAATDIGLVDRLIGLIFGVFRALALVVLILMLANLFIVKEQQGEEKSDRPATGVEIGLDVIEQSYTYRHLENTVVWVQNIFTSFAKTDTSSQTGSTGETVQESD